MSSSQLKNSIESSPHISIEIVEELSTESLQELCKASNDAIETGGGFGWINTPQHQKQERYWQGVLLVPERHLIVARMNGTICGAIQLIEPSRHNEAQSFSANLIASFVAPWARNFGAGKKLIQMAEKLAFEMDYKVLQIDLRETQKAAIRLYESIGYKRWGVNPSYAIVDGPLIRGFYYHKIINPSFVAQKF